nr:MAG TPA: hypothetical protein [Caudoviricetes sp.]
MHCESNIKELKSLSDTRDELKEYECMMDRKHKAITVYTKQVKYFEVELENVSENEAIEQAKAQINCRDIEADDEEVLIDDMDIHD